jgi:hypothetical protein
MRCSVTFIGFNKLLKRSGRGQVKGYNANPEGTDFVLGRPTDLSLLWLRDL